MRFWHVGRAETVAAARSSTRSEFLDALLRQGVLATFSFAHAVGHPHILG
jgi:hypothetical protein